MPLTAFERLKINFFKRLEVTVMSKNQEERANYYLYIDGQAVPVSEEIYRVYWQPHFYAFGRPNY